MIHSICPQPIAQRKHEQLCICLEHDVRHRHLTTGLERYRLPALEHPPSDPAPLDLSALLLGRPLRAPIMIGAMTGGTPLARRINHHLAIAAQTLQLAMCVGSQRAALLDPELADTYQVRAPAPDIVLLANLGIAQLGQGWDAQDCQAAVDMIGADGLMLHYNPLQESLQEPQEAFFADGLQAIAEITRRLSVPVLAKEVGWGLPVEVARQLWASGVSGFDTGGAGGTCWAEVLRHTREPVNALQLQHAASSGIPTARAIRDLRHALPNALIIAGGGIRTGANIAKSLALGADLVSIAHPLLQPAMVSAQAVIDTLQDIIAQLEDAMRQTGACDLADLRAVTLYEQQQP